MLCVRGAASSSPPDVSCYTTTSQKRGNREEERVALSSASICLGDDETGSGEKSARALSLVQAPARRAPRALAAFISLVRYNSMHPRSQRVFIVLFNIIPPPSLRSIRHCVRDKSRSCAGDTAVLPDHFPTSNLTTSSYRCRCLYAKRGRRMTASRP